MVGRLCFSATVAAIEIPAAGASALIHERLTLGDVTFSDGYPAGAAKTAAISAALT